MFVVSNAPNASCIPSIGVKIGLPIHLVVLGLILSSHRPLVILNIESRIIMSGKEIGEARRLEFRSHGL